jgi:signal transduction histidine kinase
MAHGLASNSILSIAEDQKNRFYVATTRGLNHVDFDTGSIKRFTANDGLANDRVDTIFRDSRGVFWFGTSSGVSRLIPQPEATRVLPSIFINRVKVVGESRHISEMGETDLRGVELAADQNHIAIEFGSLFFAAGDLLRYQYKLEGADGGWQPPTFQRSVNYANLKPGSYRFLVRAVNSEGSVSPQPAMLEFRVIAQIWQRWWFLTLAGVLLGLAVYSMYRYRLAQKLKVERVRTRIATDLHDDIGSSLSQIAIMSEVVRQQVSGENQRVSRPLSVIAGTSRELVDSMADIVWAINPKRDHLIDLTQRMRQFAGDVLPARNIEFTFAAPGLESDIPIETDVRREVFLIFKEAINNAVRHSECFSVEIKFGVNDTRLMLKVADNGRSFNPARTSGGHGLASMKRRAQSIGGTLEILAQTGGTTITLEAPLRRRRLRRMKIST